MTTQYYPMKITTKYNWIFREYFSILRVHISDLIQPRKMPAWSKGDKGDVVIVHGYNDVGARLRTLASRLNALGYRIHTLPELDRQRDPVPVAAKKLADHINKKMLRDYYIISHSKGSLVTKYAIYKEDMPTPKKIFSIAPPFGGSVFGHIRILSLHEMRPGSKILRELAEFKNKNHLFVTLYPSVDNMILIPNSSYLEGAENIQLQVKGHTLVIEDEQMMQEIINRIIARS